MKKKPLDSKEIGLEIGLLVGRFFMNSDDLHYGYWEDDVPVNLLHCSVAQKAYSDLLVRQIPENINSILDVGSGSGNTAKRLIDRGHYVECVSPSHFLSSEIERKLGNKIKIYKTLFEKIETNNTYDLILFSESFQYVPIEESLRKCIQLLKPSGYILICDFFQKDPSHFTELRGGHSFPRFNEVIQSFPLKEILNLDITTQTAPTIQILDDFLSQFGNPLKSLMNSYATNRYPTLTKLIKWKYRKRIKKLNRIYFSGELTAQEFIEQKTYRFMLFQIQ
jgi:SAM-dependent methyltransferase